MIYYLKDMDMLDDSIIQKWESKYNLSCKKTKSGVLSFAVKVLLKWVLFEKYKIPLEKSLVLKDDSGKPYICDIPLKFSLSHSKTVAAVVVSDSNIGMDVQKFPEYSEKLASRICSSDELAELEKSPHKSRTLAEIWARKESYIKFCGNKKWDKIPDIPSGGCKTCVFESDFAASVYTLKDYQIRTEKIEWSTI